MRDLRALAEGRHDLLVVGGGIIGAGIARDAARRGLRTVLVEQEDFGSGTSSRPTRLVHGGLRYLEQFDFALVRSDMREREILLRVAPHLVFPLPFLLPIYGRGIVYRARLRAGMQLYDLLSYDKSLPRRRWLDRGAALRADPQLRPQGLQGAWRFYDAQVPLVERLVLENVLDAAGHGAKVFNHARVTHFLRQGDRVSGASVEDRLNGNHIPVQAALTVNATGPWLDLSSQELRPGRPPLLRRTKGIHVVTPAAGRLGQVLFARADGRLFFVVPWLGCSMIGTTDTDFDGDPEQAVAEAEDVRYLLAAAREAFPSVPFDEVHYTMAGVRALVRVEGVKEGEVSRKHALHDHLRAEGVHGILSVVGGKLTAYRGIAEEVVDWACARMGRRLPCDTARQPLPGAPLGGPELLGSELAARGQALGLELAQTEHLAQVYGARAEEVLALAASDPALRERLDTRLPDVGAQVVHAVQQEWAWTVADFLLRRAPLGMGPGQGLAQAPAVARRMADLLGWDRDQQAAQVDTYGRQVEPMRRFSGDLDILGSSGEQDARAKPRL
jgi:glycerol-3-phosphate dehydrogenase